MGYLTFTGVVIICIGSLRASEPQNNLETETKSDVLDNFDNHNRNDSLSDPKQSLNAVFSALSQALNLLQHEYQNLNLDTVIGTRIVEGKISSDMMISLGRKTRGTKFQNVPVT